MKKLTHLDEKGKASMVHVGDKPMQARIARATGYITLNKETLQLVRNNQVKKGDVLTVSEIAGIQAAKRTAELIPLCHNIVLDQVSVRATMVESGVTIESEVRCTGTTGAEMEALTAINVALLTIYDMCKATDKEMVLGDIRLIEKSKADLTKGESSKKIHTSHPSKMGHAHTVKIRKAAIITVSDRASRGEYEDKSGPLLQQILQDHLKGSGNTFDVEMAIVPDESIALKTEILRLLEKGKDVIFTTGGTGIGPRDITCDTIKPLLDKEIPGIMEMIRVKYGKEFPNALLSRTVAGVTGHTLIFSLPGSPAAVREYLHEILKSLDHSFGMVHGGGH